MKSKIRKSIPFNRPPYTGKEEAFVLEAIQSSHLSGDGPFAKKVQHWFENELDTPKTLLTPSCTQALEMAALLIDVQPDDEIIMPSFTFVSTANAFVMRGAKIVFVDIEPNTMNINPELLQAALSPQTKAIVPVHYAGVSCQMQSIMDIAQEHQIYVIEDAAQGMMSHYRGQALGTIGHIGTYSFHETKNYTSGGEGGLLILNDEQFIKRAEIIREKGTNRNQFFRGLVDKYSWVDIGSSYLPSELQAAYLWGQLQSAKEILDKRLILWKSYYDHLKHLKDDYLDLPFIPHFSQHNGHMFYIKVKNISVRQKLITHLQSEQIQTAFHYVPLHSSQAGLKYSRFCGIDQFTTRESERLLRLPMHLSLELSDIQRVCASIESFFSI